MMCGRVFMGRDGEPHICNIGANHGCGCTYMSRGASVAEEGTLDTPFVPLAEQRRLTQLEVAKKKGLFGKVRT